MITLDGGPGCQKAAIRAITSSPAIAKIPAAISRSRPVRPNPIGAAVSDVDACGGSSSFMAEASRAKPGD
jgi:hypothetical protein